MVSLLANYVTNCVFYRSITFSSVYTFIVQAIHKKQSVSKFGIKNNKGVFTLVMQKLDLIKLYSNKRALVVDEFPDMRASIRRMLRSFGVETVDVANDGGDAMARCRENQYDIIICDYSLGKGKNGQQILEELRFTQSLNHQAIYILVTAEVTRSMVFGALEYKPDDYLIKPFNPLLLQARFDNLMLEKNSFSLMFMKL